MSVALPRTEREVVAPEAWLETARWEQRFERRVLAPLAHTGWRYYAWVGFLLLVIGLAVYAYIQQLFFIGISHAGTLLSAILRATKARWQLSITRMAELITVVALLVGALFPFIDLGRPDRVFNLIFFGRWQSPLLWDILAITTYLTGSAIYLYLPLIPDFARCRDRLGVIHHTPPGGGLPTRGGRPARARSRSRRHNASPTRDCNTC